MYTIQIQPKVGEPHSEDLQKKDQTKKTFQFACADQDNLSPFLYSLKFREKKPYTCEICQKICRTVHSLRNHRKSHTKEKVCTCEQCGKRFTQVSNMRQHMKIHTGEKPYDCELCGKAFSRKEHLTLHLTTHTDDKLFQCDTCDKKFRYSSNMSRHKKTHSTAKPYECYDKGCFKAFSRLANLQRHKEISHPQNSSSLNQRHSIHKKQKNNEKT